MQNVPKIVRERLQAAPPVVDHPDADVLTAFAEMSLPDRERGLVLEHLSRCGDCRDVLALALPASEAVETVTVRARGGRLMWPALRWGFVTAGVAAIILVGVLEVQRRQSPMAFKTTSGEQAVATEARNQPPAVQPAAPSEKKDQDKVEASAHRSTDTGSVHTVPMLTAPKQMLRSEAPTRTYASQFHGGAAGSAMGGAVLRSGPNAGAQSQQLGQSQGQPALNSATPAISGQQTAKLSQPAPIPPTSQTVDVTGEAPTTVDATQAQVSQVQTADQQSLDDSASRLSKAKPAGAVQAEGSGAPPSMPRQLLRWTISSAGVLQRSFDGGNTWQDVDVSAGSMFANNLTSLEVSAEASRTKERDGAKKTLKAPAPTLVFRAVAANGADVWAGGSSGMLYHSLDAGGHWTRIVPAAAGIALTGDIVSLQFSDPPRGRVITSTPEVWITSDDGQSWQKQ